MKLFLGKTSRLAALVVTLGGCHQNLPTTPTNQIQEKAGGVDGSGGNSAHTTPETVDKLVELLPELMPKLITRLEIEYRDTQAALTEAEGQKPKDKSDEDDRLTEVANAWFPQSGEQALRESIGRLRYQSLEKCLHDGQAADATYTPQGTVCFSRNRLSQYPTAGMVREVILLAFHEYAHYFGFGEAHAQAIQRLVTVVYPVLVPAYENLWQTQMTIDEFVNTDAAIKNDLGDAETQDVQICHRLGIFTERLNHFFPGGFLPTFAMRWRELKSLSDSASGFCGSNNPDIVNSRVPITALGDRLTLTSRIEEISSLVDQLLPDQYSFLAGDFSIAGPKPNLIFGIENYLHDHGIEIQFPHDH